MRIGPLEYLVISVKDEPFRNTILPELNTLQEEGLIRVVDLLFVTKAADGQVALREVNELGEEDLSAYEGLADDLMGWLTAEDIETLAGELPPDTEAVVVLLEHTWAFGLTEAVHKAGGVLFTGGLVTPEALQQVTAELAAKEG